MAQTNSTPFGALGASDACRQLGIEERIIAGFEREASNSREPDVDAGRCAPFSFQFSSILLNRSLIEQPIRLVAKPDQELVERLRVSTEGVRGGDTVEDEAGDSFPVIFPERDPHGGHDLTISPDTMKAKMQTVSQGSVVDKRYYHRPEIPSSETTVRSHNRAKELIEMPAKPAWLLKIPEIMTMLESFDVPVVDRAIIEHLFGLRRRQAIELRHRFGGDQAGKTFLVDRHVLIENLRRLAAGEGFGREIRRKERLDGAIDQLRRHQAAARVIIPVAPDVYNHKLKDLSAGVALEPGHLHVAFSVI